jgi:hypothetical protein
VVNFVVGIALLPWGHDWLPDPGAGCWLGHYRAKWPLMSHLKQGPKAWLPWFGVFYEDRAAGQNDCGEFWHCGGCTFCRFSCCGGRCIGTFGLCIWNCGRENRYWGRCVCNGTCSRFICEGQKNWLGCEKRSLTLLLEGCLWNSGFRLPSFSISLILFSITMALSTTCWKST